MEIYHQDTEHNLVWTFTFVYRWYILIISIQGASGKYAHFVLFHKGTNPIHVTVKSKVSKFLIS
jgi:hypothetical protein